MGRTVSGKMTVFLSTLNQMGFLFFLLINLNYIQTELNICTF